MTQKNKDEDFTYAELIEYEELIGESFEEIDNSKKPRLKKLATLGWIRAKRENPGLKFATYIDETEAEQIFKDATGFTGEEAEDEEKKSESVSEKPARKTKQDSV